MSFSHRAAPPEPVGSDCAGSDRRPPLARAQFPAFLSLPREGFFSCRASRGSGPAQPGTGCAGFAWLSPPDFRSPLGASHFHERNKTSVILLRSSRIKKQRARTNARQNNGFVVVRRAAVCGASTLSLDPLCTLWAHNIRQSATCQAPRRPPRRLNFCCKRWSAMA